MKRVVLVVAMWLTLGAAGAQGLTQTVRGVVVDKLTQVPLIGATVVLVNATPPRGASTDVDGAFVIDKVPVGRQSFACSYVGYNSAMVADVMVSSARELVLTISLEEKVNSLAEVSVTAFKKEEAQNKMATVSARTLSVEEASRYAGGSDDPARLAASFAGVASGLSNNGIVIRGNAPKGLLWRLEDVEIDNPNHFANIQAFGGGGMTALSSRVLANSDFFTGAFPAEYGNALSGVFDLKMRTGNNQKFEHAIQVGSLGIDAASEGPLVPGRKSSYMFNYRYSTLALITPILPAEAGRISYQDVSFKVNFPSRTLGTLAVWGLGSTDGQVHDAVMDSTRWKTNADLLDYSTSARMGAAGVTYKKIVGPRTNLTAIIATSGSAMDWAEKKLDNQLVARPTTDITSNNWRLIGSVAVNHKVNEHLSVKTGGVFTRVFYKVAINNAQRLGDELTTYVDKAGYADKLQAYVQTKYAFSEQLSVNAGIHEHYYALIHRLSLEPRLGTRWNVAPDNTLTFAYGLHSQAEPSSFYLADVPTDQGISHPNLGLDFTRAHHLVLGYERQLNENTRLKCEPYVQYVFSVPVVKGRYYSLQNVESDWFFRDSLVNNGTGRNIGIDLTLEKFLTRGFYYLATVSLFDSRYKGGDGTWRQARFNKRYVVNILAGKEWGIGPDKRNTLGLNGRVCLMGGDRTIPVLMQQSVQQREIVYDEANAFTTAKPAAQIVSFSLNYRINKPRHSSFWSLHVINMLMEKEFQGYEYNAVTQAVEKREDPFFIPYISYTLEF